MSDTNWGDMAMGLGTLIVVGAVANKMMNTKPSKNGLFGEHKLKPMPKSKLWK